MDNQYSNFVSVIIPVFNDSERLQKCLEALQNQTYPQDLYEVIVVDNGSDESIESVVNQFNQALAAYESTPGSYAARNKGISLAKGEVLAFTDSDCLPAYNWLETGVKHLLSVPNCGLVAGKINMFFKDPNRPRAVELYDSITYLDQKQYIEQYNFGATANLFTFKKVFQDVGLFNHQLKSWGDKEWGNRVFSFDYSIIYADDCCVDHPARNSIIQLSKRIIRLQGGGYDFHKYKNKENNSYLLQLIKKISGLRPPLRSAFRQVISNEKLKNNQQKIQVFLIMLFIHYAKFFEKTRLQLGVGAGATR